MKTFNIIIEETVSEAFKIKAETLEEAMEIAEEKYYSGKLVLSPGEVVTKQMMGEDLTTGDCTEWTEF